MASQFYEVERIVASRKKVIAYLHTYYLPLWFYAGYKIGVFSSMDGLSKGTGILGAT